MNLFDLTGKTAIVTGGTRGLGHGMAEGLLEAGCRVAETAYLNEQKNFGREGISARA